MCLLQVVAFTCCFAYCIARSFYLLFCLLIAQTIMLNVVLNFMFRAGRNKRFSCRAILLAARYFIERGHRIYAFVPEYRFTQSINNPHKPIDDQWILGWMENRGLVVFTPSRQIVAEDGSKRRIACYDDKYFVYFLNLH